MNEEFIPAPRGFRCPVCKGENFLYFASSEIEGAETIVCRRDGWQGEISSAIYEQRFISQARSRSKKSLSAWTTIIILIIITFMILPAIASPPPTVVLFKEFDSKTWILKVYAVRNVGNLQIDDVMISVEKPGNMTGLEPTNLYSMNWGCVICGVNYTNLFPFDYLNKGDYFCLDKGMYEKDSEVKLISLDGSIVYCQRKIEYASIP